MPVFRPDITAISPYVPGRPLEEVAAEVGLPVDLIVKLASNESPEGPFPGVAERGAAVLAESNRYPDNDMFSLAGALAATVGLSPDHVWLGAGSTALLGALALAVGGPGTEAVYPWPSFVMYRIVSRWAGARTVEVPLRPDHVIDLDALGAAVGDDATVVYLCNPNNPTGTVLPGDDVARFIASVPESVLVVVDEAYHHFVTDPSYRSFAGEVAGRPNLVVLRTFSKVYALASQRVGYALAHPETISELRKAQVPFGVSQVAQVMAEASLQDPEELARRVAANANGRRHLLDALAARGVEHTPSEANFVYLRVGDDSTAAAFTSHGVIVRPMSRGWLRVTVGLPAENTRFLDALDAILD